VAERPRRKRPTGRAASTALREDHVRQHALADSGPLLALFNAADPWHGRIVTWLRDRPNVRLITTWPVLTEVCALLARRLSNDAALDFLRWVERGALEVDRAESTTLAEVLLISERFADLPFDLADSSLAEAAARLQVANVVSLDSDFDVYRDRSRKALTNLLRASAPRRR
jgi:hypothetical protein